FFSLFFSAVLASAWVGPQAQAGAEHRTVAFGDLDLATAAGRAKLRYRIGIALEAVCGSYDGALIDEEHDIKLCRKKTRARIDAQLMKMGWSEGSSLTDSR